MKRSLLTLLIITMTLCHTHASDLNVMTFNVRYDAPFDKPHHWDARKDNVYKTISQNNIHICGTQEVLAHQMDAMKVALPDYAFIGVGRDDGKRAGEFCALLYKKADFTFLESGVFWLSETPNKSGSRGWDAMCNRTATWARLKRHLDGKTIFVINAHLDHAGKIARVKSTTLLLEQTKSLAKGSPVILLGDLNAKPDHPVIKQIQSSNLCTESRAVAQRKVGPQWTYHGFNRIPLEERPTLDYIFVSPSLKVNSHTTLYK